MKIPAVITDKTATLYVAGEVFTIDRATPTFEKVSAELIKPVQDLAAIQAILRSYTTEEVKFANKVNYGTVEITRRAVLFNGEQVNSALTARILDIVQAGLDADPWVNFMKKLYLNPAEHAREELYLWLEQGDLPITEDGDFLAYKRVRSNFKDIHSGNFDNSPGSVVELPGGRGVVDDVRDNLCSVGLHFCSKSYLPSFGAGGHNSVVLLKINPADVVSIPSDYDNAKGRTWKYEVLSEVDWDIPSKVWNPIVGNDGANYDGYDEDGYDEDGYDMNGYDEEGYDRNCYDVNGLDDDGRDEDGYDVDGYDWNGYDMNGRDEDGNDVDGYDKYGRNEYGFNEDGFNEDGYDRNGYDEDGYNEDGYNRNGYDEDGYDRNGFNEDGFDRNGHTPEPTPSFAPPTGFATPWWLL